jgi:NADH dehydrogenase FAD-containing subunit
MEPKRVSMEKIPQGPRVVIVGGGFGGLHAAKSLGADLVEAKTVLEQLSV